MPIKIIKPALFGFIIIMSGSLSPLSELAAGTTARFGSGSEISTLLILKDKRALLREADNLDTGTVLKRACEIQLTKGWPPVSCFAFVKSETETLELTEECRRLALRAPVLPALNPHVTETCRNALESRSLDLKYVKSGSRAAARGQASDASR
ncbi:MAG: hypothetical protein J0L82_09470 [Deltaproteobacteria bacterium]|nr:hypothetical protein [Deltaproteobacteria bacterium]